MKLEEAKFRAWLTALPPGAEAGRALRPQGHPLGRWIESQFKPGATGVFYPTRYVITGGPEIRLPEWATTFVQRSNNEKAPGKRVTREECLDLLEADS